MLFTAVYQMIVTDSVTDLTLMVSVCWYFGLYTDQSVVLYVRAIRQ